MNYVDPSGHNKKWISLSVYMIRTTTSIKKGLQAIRDSFKLKNYIKSELNNAVIESVIKEKYQINGRAKTILPMQQHLQMPIMLKLKGVIENMGIIIYGQK